MRLLSSFIRKVLLVPTVAVLFLFLTNSAFASTLTITSPNGGENFTVGDAVHITWTTDSSGAPCSLYYITQATGVNYLYSIGSASSSAQTFDWTAAIPSGTTSSQLEKIELACSGLPVDYSDNYFTVSPPTTPQCNLSPVVSLTDNSTPSIHEGESITNNFTVQNPNDVSCGTSTYNITQTYPSGWSMSIPSSISVAAGSSSSAPLTLTSSNSASYQTYQYSVTANDSYGNMPTAIGNVAVIPYCNATVQASLSSPSLTAIPGQVLSNNLTLTNPNPAACASKTYIYSYQFPSNWMLSIAQNAAVPSGGTVSVPFNLTVWQNAVPNSYNYSFWVYSNYNDGSGQAQVNGTVNVQDIVAPTVTITSPTGTTINRRSTIAFNANATDNAAVTKVEFYVNGVLQCTDTVAPYNCSFTASSHKNVDYQLSVKAYDAASNIGTDSKTVTTQ